MTASVWLCVVAYTLGSIPFGLLLTRLAGLGDLRQIGSGNIGATNVLRTGHRALAAATLLLDALKGAVAVLLAQYVLKGDVLTAEWVALAALLGHMFPVWLKFRGGKGVATALGVWLALSPIIALGMALAWLVGTSVTRISSVGALALCVALPAVTYWLAPWLAPLALVVAALVVLKHTANITRLLAGTEPKIGQSMKENK